MYTKYTCTITGDVLRDSAINSCELANSYLTESFLCNSNICKFGGSMKLLVGDINIYVKCPFKPLGLVVTGYFVGILSLCILMTPIIFVNKISLKSIAILRIWNSVYTGIISLWATVSLCYNRDTSISYIVGLEFNQTPQILLLSAMYLICFFSLIQGFSRNGKEVFVNIQTTNPSTDMKKFTTIEN